MAAHSLNGNGKGDVLRKEARKKMKADRKTASKMAQYKDTRIGDKASEAHMCMLTLGQD